MNDGTLLVTFGFDGESTVVAQAFVYDPGPQSFERTAPMFVWWGKELVNLHNDAYRPVLGKKHPTAMGQRRGWTTI